MNMEQMKDQLRVWIIGLAGTALGWFASKGWINEQQVSAIISSPVAIAAATMAAGAVLSFLNRTEKNSVAILDKIAKEPDSLVRGVLLEPTAEGVALANTLPGSTTVPAGTVGAAALAAS